MAPRLRRWRWLFEMEMGADVPVTKRVMGCFFLYKQTYRIARFVSFLIVVPSIQHRNRIFLSIIMLNKIPCTKYVFILRFMHVIVTSKVS